MRVVNQSATGLTGTQARTSGECSDVQISTAAERRCRTGDRPSHAPETGPAPTAQEPAPLLDSTDQGSQAAHPGHAKRKGRRIRTGRDGCRPRAAENRRRPSAGAAPGRNTTTTVAVGCRVRAGCDARFAGDHMDACGVPLSADDPPIYESEASYLKRLGLFVSGERKRIRRVDFSPVAIRIVDGYIGEYRVGLQ